MEKPISISLEEDAPRLWHNFWAHTSVLQSWVRMPVLMFWSTEWILYSMLWFYILCDTGLNLGWTRTCIPYISTTTQHVRRMYANLCTTDTSNSVCASFALSPLFCSHLSDPYVNDQESLTPGQPSSVPAAWPLTHSHSSHAQRSAFLTKPASTGDLSYLTSYSQLTKRNFSLTLSFSLSPQSDSCCLGICVFDTAKTLWMSQIFPTNSFLCV